MTALLTVDGAVAAYRWLRWMGTPARSRTADAPPRTASGITRRPAPGVTGGAVHP